MFSRVISEDSSIVLEQHIMQHTLTHTLRVSAIL